VTLVPDPPASCAGVAYLVSSTQLDVALAILDDRESGGYTRHRVPLAFLGDLDPGDPDAASATAEVTGWVYVAGCENPNFTGPAALAEIARVIEGAHGPSGANLEYVLRLADALRELQIEDPEVSALERLLRPA